jgi:hypothetical protein
MSLGGCDVINAQLLQLLHWIKKLINNLPLCRNAAKFDVNGRYWYRILTVFVKEMDDRSATCCQSEEATAVCVRLTEQLHAVHEKCCISTFATPLPWKHTRRKVFQRSAPSIFWSQCTCRVQTKSYAQWSIGQSWVTMVASAQIRCMILQCLWYAIVFTQTNSNYTTYF